MLRLSIISHSTKMKKILAILAVLVLMASPAFATSYTPPATAEVDGDVTNEINTITADDANATTGLAITVAGGGINATTVAGDVVTVTGTEVDSVVGAVNGVVVADGAGNISAAANLTDAVYLTTEIDPTVDSSAEIVAIIGAGVYQPAGTYDSVVTAGRDLTRTGDDIAVDAEIYTKVASIAIADPADTMDGLVQMTFPTAVTITSVACSTDTGTADIQFDERALATPNTAGTDVLTSALQCDDNNASTTDLANASIAADQPLSMDIDAVASTPTKLRIFVKYTIDD